MAGFDCNFCLSIILYCYANAVVSIQYVPYKNLVGSPDLRSFTSYASDYDMHRGSSAMADLSRGKQDELIQLMFQPEGDYQAFVTENDVKHEQPDALWTIIVSMGCLLERKHAIRDFTRRTNADCDAIIATLMGSKLWLRLEEAFPPFDNYRRKEDYDWSEIETFSAKDAIADLDGDDAQQYLLKYLARPEPPLDGVIFRMPYQTYKHEFDAGRLVSFVDRGMAVQAYRSSDSIWTSILPASFLIGLLAFIPIAVFYSFWVGLAVLTVAIISRKMLTKKAVDWVRQDALANRDRYRWYVARDIVWALRR